MTTLDWSNCLAVERSPDKLSFENLEGGATVDDFLKWFPGVSREQVVAVVEFAQQSLATTGWERNVHVLFDQGTPDPLRHALTAHVVSTAYEMGWSALAKGDLLGGSGGKSQA